VLDVRHDHGILRAGRHEDLAALVVVADGALVLMLALARRLPEACDNQEKRVWPGMIGDLTQREDELGGKTLLIVGLGQIGGRLAQVAKAFDMRVIGIRRRRTRRIVWLNADCETPSFAAAFVKLRSRPTATRARRSSNFASCIYWHPL
jgi:phosphoglycerate dehydrogenase-like enzyme